MQVLGKEMEMIGLRRLVCSAALLAALSLAATGSATAKRADSPAIYNPVTKSYFMLTRLPKGSTRWTKARIMARSMSFRGVRGRLASVDSAATMSFVRDNFEIKSSTWVGGRVICKGAKLLWENGNIHKKGDYSRWHRQWHRTWIKCGGKLKYMPVNLTAEKKGFYWRASGPNKGYNPVLVEFRTGKP